MTRYWVSFVFLLCHLFVFSSLFWSFHMLSWIFVIFIFYQQLFGSWMLNLHFICSLQSVVSSLPADHYQSVFLLNKSKVLFRIGKIRLFEFTSTTGQWIHIWVVHGNSECCRQWGASFVTISFPEEHEAKSFQPDFHSFWWQRIWSHCQKIHCLLGAGVCSLNKYFENKSYLEGIFLKPNRDLYHKLPSCLLSLILSSLSGSFIFLLSFSYLFIFCAIILSGASISLFSFSIKKVWKTERWKENSKVGTEFQTKHDTGNWSETQIRNSSSPPTQKRSKPQSQARAVWQGFLSWRIPKDSGCRFGSVAVYVCGF